MSDAELRYAFLWIHLIEALMVKPYGRGLTKKLKRVKREVRGALRDRRISQWLTSENSTLRKKLREHAAHRYTQETGRPLLFG